ncbi:hypothetical protein DPMN_136519 [Dreissena polymorpha]|uniref:Uncharacterized protein n=1 Tax=Dreissena polymorpha TaxID=45954 RepID=A0A9D4G3S0_DREPO|nr:hypothetical protein DPMN_136519 [Dreissena polymorpha]
MTIEIKKGLVLQSINLHELSLQVVDKPFRNGQLMSIHGFVRNEEEMKQVPLHFVLMSRRRKEDYVAVLQKVKDVMNNFSVEGFMIDFEAGKCPEINAYNINWKVAP